MQDMQDDVTEEEQKEYEATLDRMCAEWERRVRDQARAHATRRDIVSLYEVRLGCVREELRAALARIQSAEELRRILIVTATRTVEDVSAAVREAASAG